MVKKRTHTHTHRVVVVYSVEDWEPLKGGGILVQAKIADQNWKGVLMAGEVPGQSTAKVPLSKVADRQMLMAPLCSSLLTLCHLSQNA